MKEKDEIVKYLLNTKEPYILKIDNMKIEIEYSKNGKRIDECMLNILKQKIKKD